MKLGFCKPSLICFNLTAAWAPIKGRSVIIKLIILHFGDHDVSLQESFSNYHDDECWMVSIMIMDLGNDHDDDLGDV